MAPKLSKFETYLQYIGNQITIKDKDKEPFTKDFDGICYCILNNMCKLNIVFKWIYKGTSLFGSYAYNARIRVPNEFDVHLKLCFPYSRSINVIPDPDRPAHVFLDFEEVLSDVEDHNGYEELYDFLDDIVDWDNNYLRRSTLNKWISELIEEALDTYGYYVKCWSGKSYKLEYSKRGLAHTIYAHCMSGNKNDNISIDFIPAIVFGVQDWIETRSDRPFTNKCNQWFAIPKPTHFGPKETKVHSFMICNPKAEHDLLLQKQNLKVVLRLLKSLRDEYGLKKLKSYFFTTAFLYEVEEQEESFWHQPLENILVHMLDVITDYFLNENLPFFWNSDLNLLDILSDEELSDYTEKLLSAYNTLRTYSCQPRLTYGRCASHFEIYDK